MFNETFFREAKRVGVIGLACVGALTLMLIAVGTIAEVFSRPKPAAYSAGRLDFTPLQREMIETDVDPDDRDLTEPQRQFGIARKMVSVFDYEGYDPHAKRPLAMIVEHGGEIFRKDAWGTTSFSFGGKDLKHRMQLRVTPGKEGGELWRMIGEAKLAFDYGTDCYSDDFRAVGEELLQSAFKRIDKEGGTRLFRKLDAGYVWMLQVREEPSPSNGPPAYFVTLTWHEQEND